MIKRVGDILGACGGLLILGPVLVPVCILIWLEDRHSPFYIAPRVGRDGEMFRMVKLRSMVNNADRSGVDSTAADDVRITRVGSFVRRFKLDEFGQLWNVLVGDMSLVGPRPQVQRDVARYTSKEKRLLTVRPGITDFSSIVFADEGDILEGAEDPDIRYNQLIRPWKSRLGLHYVGCQSLWLDVRLVWATVLNAFARNSALKLVTRLLNETGAEETLVSVATRTQTLTPHPPPGASQVAGAAD